MSLPKPRLAKWMYAPVWNCRGGGSFGWGLSPEEAYRSWYAAFHLLPRVPAPAIDPYDAIGKKHAARIAESLKAGINGARLVGG